VRSPRPIDDVGLEVAGGRTTGPRPLPRHGLHDGHPLLFARCNRIFAEEFLYARTWTWLSRVRPLAWRHIGRVRGTPERVRFLVLVELLESPDCTSAEVIRSHSASEPSAQTTRSGVVSSATSRTQRSRREFVASWRRGPTHWCSRLTSMYLPACPLRRWRGQPRRRADCGRAGRMAGGDGPGLDAPVP
jgi:hypothetical protein